MTMVTRGKESAPPANVDGAAASSVAEGHRALSIAVCRSPIPAGVGMTVPVFNDSPVPREIPVYLLVDIESNACIVQRIAADAMTSAAVAEQRDDRLCHSGAVR